MTWVEVKCADEEDVRQTLAISEPDHYHHFWYEPWHPDGPVLRMEGNGAALHGDFWSVGPDEKFYGDDWSMVRDFFQASSRLALYGSDDPARLVKITHCHLNANGLDVEDEFWWALRFAWNRMRILWRSDRWSGMLALIRKRALR